MEITLDLAKKQRPLKNLPINMKITGWISPYLIYLFSILSIHPNLITLTWIVLAFIGFYFIALGNYTNMVVGILIYHFALLLDSSDGGVARILGKTNAGGEFLDRFFSTINRSLILLVIGFGLFRVRQITMDDAHIFCTEEQVQEEIIKVLNLVNKFYSIFNFEVKLFKCFPSKK